MSTDGEKLPLLSVEKAHTTGPSQYDDESVAAPVPASSEASAAVAPTDQTSQETKNSSSDKSRGVDEPRVSSRFLTAAINTSPVRRDDLESDAGMLSTRRLESIFRQTVRSYSREHHEDTSKTLRNEWESAPKGQVSILEDAVDSTGLGESFAVPGISEHCLGQLRATAIAGNDITSSCLYSAGIVATSAGKFAPFSSLIVATVLYFFRSIYSEVCSALPMNGGTYNALLNTTNKLVAALAAVLTTLSYTATAVTSAASAGAYLHYQWDAIPDLGVTLGILIIFAVLSFIGISESATTATVLFIAHLATMAGLIIFGVIFIIKDNAEMLKQNWNSSSHQASPHDKWYENLFMGYSTALLGITGFETSANYIEEQRPGVFPKTLRNMWVAVSFLNPVLNVVAMSSLPITLLVDNADYSLAITAEKAVGPWLRTIVVVDAALVLSGAVLTSYVGITGLHRRLALDRIMPHFFLQTNKWRGTNHFIILAFCVLTCSLRLLVSDMNTLGGVYAIAFLSVMALFTISNLVLKYKRGKLPRKPITPVVQVVVAFAFVIAGLVGNLYTGDNAKWFMMYFVVFTVVVFGMMFRVQTLRLLHHLVAPPFPAFALKIRKAVVRIRSNPVVFFTKTASLNTLNKAVTYVLSNEDTHKLVIVHCEPPGMDESALIAELEENCSIMHRMYPKLSVDLIIIRQRPFTPNVVQQLVRHLGIDTNFMFMTCPSDKFPHQVGHFGGVRVVTH